MSIDDAHAETIPSRPALFSLPASAPALVLRAGELLKGSGCKDGAIEIYERFIQGLQRCAMSTIESAPASTPSAGGGHAEGELPDIYPVHTHPERYSLA